MKDFIESEYFEILTENTRIGKHHLILNWDKLSKYDKESAEYFLNSPEESIKTAELAIAEFECAEKINNFKIRIDNLPSFQEIFIRNIRCEHIGKLFFIDGIVRKKTDVRPKATSARFECPSCGNIITILQLEDKFKEPSRCGCGRKGKFTLLTKELVDVQKMTLEEIPEKLDGDAQPKRINVILKDDLVSPMAERSTNPGSKIRITGFVKEIPIPVRGGGKSTTFDLILEASYAKSIEEGYDQIDLDEKDIKEIENLSKDPAIFEKLVESMAPDTKHRKYVKQGILLSLFGGVKIKRGPKHAIRGDIHVLMIGDPGTGKSALLTQISEIAPKSKFISGKGVSGPGLTCAVTRDELLGGWQLEAGALVLANKGFVLFDELDKLNEEDSSHLHTALEQQKIPISKANIQATLKSETTLIAAANPKGSRFDPYELIAKQINIPSTLVNRFDLIFPVRDIPNKDKDSQLAEFILDQHTSATTTDGLIDKDLIRKYIAYARQNIKPKVTPEVKELLKKYFVGIRNPKNKDNSIDQKLPPIPISARQLEGLIRLAVASAKTRLSKKVTIADGRKAIELLHYYLEQVGMDPDTGKIDIDRIATGVSTSERNNVKTLKKIIKELEKTKGKSIATQDILDTAQLDGINEQRANEALEKMKEDGDIFEPVKGKIRKC